MGATDLVDLINTVTGFAGFALSLITLWKVQSVRRAQHDERALVRHLYGTEQMVAQLRAASTALATLGDGNTRRLSEDLVRLVGNIEGTTRALERPQNSRDGRRKSVTMVPDDYCTANFLAQAANDARNILDFAIYRNMQFSNIFFLEGLQRAARRGVRIRVLALWSGAPDDVLRQAIAVMPRPIPDNVSVLRRQLSDAEQLIAGVVRDQWTPDERERFEYRSYDLAPGAHFTRVDNIIKFGFVGTLAQAQPMRYEERPYIELPDRSEPGVILTEHFEQLWLRSSQNRLVLT